MTTQLLQLLRERASHRRIVLARAPVLEEALHCSFEELQRSLTELADAGMVEILTPLPYLVVALSSQKWPGKPDETARTPAKTAVPGARAYSYSFHNQSIDKSKAIAREDRGAGEGEALLQEILATLGESDPTTFRAVLEHYPTAVIKTVLNRVRSIPPERLRKSRTALFRYLLAKTK